MVQFNDVGSLSCYTQNLFSIRSHSISPSILLVYLLVVCCIFYLPWVSCGSSGSPSWPAHSNHHSFYMCYHIQYLHIGLKQFWLYLVLHCPLICISPIIRVFTDRLVNTKTKRSTNNNLIILTKIRARNLYPNHKSSQFGVDIFLINYEWAKIYPPLEMEIQAAPIAAITNSRLLEPGDSMPHSQGVSNNKRPSISRFDTIS